MDERETLEFSLEDIMKEFSEHPEFEQDVQEDPPAEEAPVADDTIRMDAIGTDTIRMDAVRTDTLPADTIRMETVSADAVRLATEKLPVGTFRGAAPLEEEESVPAAPEQKEAFAEGWEPDYEQPMGEYIPQRPIIFQPKSRLRELKRKLVAGPEKRYYDLMEKGLGKLQVAIFLSLLVVLISAGATVMFALGMVQENRMRLMVFGQFFAMLLSALLGSFQLIEGILDLQKKRFSLNTLLVFTFIVCCVDAVLCLQQLRVPCCAAFSLEMIMSLWNTYGRRHIQIGQMDTMRKASHLDSLSSVPDFYEGSRGLVRGEGQVEDFMDTCDVPSTPEKVLSWYGLSALLASLVIGIVAGVMHGFSAGVQVMAVSLLAALPATAFITLSRPAALLERRLHSLGTVLCGWQGIKALCGKVVFPVSHEDLFPAGTARMNGVKFFGSRNPDEVVAYGTAVIAADGGGLTPLFMQVLESRNAHHYDAQELTAYGHGGLSAVVEGEHVLVGSLSFLKQMGVDVPEKLRVSHAVCVAVEGELCALFAITYQPTKDAAAGLRTLCAYRGLNPVMLAGNFTLTEGTLKKLFGANARRIRFPERDSREEMKAREPETDTPALLLVTTKGLAPFAYGVTGARALRTASIMGVAVHMIGGILGLAMMLTLTVLGALELLTPANMFLYQLVWIIPGLLITEWTRTI